MTRFTCTAFGSENALSLHSTSFSNNKQKYVVLA